jgi:hypothetical protein
LLKKPVVITCRPKPKVQKRKGLLSFFQKNFYATSA